MDRKNYIGKLDSLQACRLAGLHASKQIRLSACRLVSLIACFLFALCAMPFAPCAIAADKLQVLDGTLKVVSDMDKFSTFENDVSESDAFFKLANSTYGAGIFAPVLWMKSNRADGAYSNAIIADVTQDNIGQGPVFSFMARQNNASVTNRDLFWFDNYYNNPAMVIKANGRVGIGTKNPAGRLDVNGSIYQRGGQLYADYVFGKEYKLESIEDHARYMWKNAHLKGMPKALKDGKGVEIVEIGSFQKGILEELEKAHIYIEQLNEKIKTLESKIQALEAK